MSVVKRLILIREGRLMAGGLIVANVVEIHGRRECKEERKNIAVKGTAINLPIVEVSDIHNNGFKLNKYATNYNRKQ